MVNPQLKNEKVNTLLPAALKQLPQWVMWKREKREGKQTKIPYRSDGKGMASTTDAQTWSTYEVAKKAFAAGGYDGIGFVFTANDPFLGIDFDHCRDPQTGGIEPWAQTAVGDLNSYTEITPSDTGLHIIIEAELPPGGNRKGKIEMYHVGRYFTITGNHLKGTPDTIEKRQQALDELHAEIFPKVAPVKAGGNGGHPVDLDDAELISKAMAATNGEAFKGLWNGDTSAHGGDNSAADMALCNHLAFWTGNNPVRMDALFRQSALYREKWDRKDYRDRTIERAIANTSETYKQREIAPQARKEQPQLEAEQPQVFNANAAPSRKDVPHLFDITHGGKALPVNEATTWFAQAGSGKSITAGDYLPILLSNGIPDSSFCALGQGNILILDWEADLETHRRYITAIKRGLSKRVNTDLDSGIIHYMPLFSPLTRHADFIRDFIRDNDIILVVLDSQMASMAGAFSSLKDDQIAGIYYNILASWATTTLTIDHVPKSAMNTDYGVGAAYGSVVKYQRARSVFELKQAQEPGENIIELAFINQKNNLGPKLKPFGLKIQFDNDKDGDLNAISFDTFDLADSSKLEKVRPLWERARDAIMWEFNGRATTGQLAVQLEIGEGTIRTILNRYDKVFTKVEKSREGTTWGLVTLPA